MSENKIKFPVKLASNNPQSFGLADATEVSGHRSVDTLSDLYSISDPILSILKDGSDAIGQEWFVVSEDCKYRLDNWENRKTVAGWTKLPKQELINTKQSVSEKDQPSGYAGLDSNGKIPIEKTYGTTATVVDVETYESLPVTGLSGVIYYVLSTGVQYKWSGSAYIEITNGADNAKKNETSIFDCSNGTSTKYYSSLSDAISAVPVPYRTSNRIISYLSTENSTTSAVNYQYHGIDSTTWTDLTKWEHIPNQTDLAEIRSLTNQQFGQLEKERQEKIDPGFFIEFRKRFIENGYYSSIDNYSCTSILVGDGSEYIFPPTGSGGCTYKIFQYISDSEGTEITTKWENGELRYNITGKFIVTFNGQFTEEDESIYEWLVANWRLGGYNVAIEPRMKFLEESAILNMKLQSASLIGNTKEKEIYIPFPEFYTKNLLNLEDSDVMLGYRQYSDTPQQNASYNLSGYIPVTPGVTYCYSTRNQQYKEFIYYVVFDSNRNFIRNGNETSVFTAQTGDSYIRITLRSSSWNMDNQFEIGNTPTEYKPFGVRFKFPDIDVPQIIMPKIVYTTKGVENSIYHKNYCDFITDNFTIASYRNYNSATWKHLSRCFRTTNGNQTIEIELYQKSPFKLLNEVSVQSVVGDPETDNGNINVICIGDSFTYDGRYLQQIADICPNINLVGMRKPAQDTQNDFIRCEGRGGWTLDEYKLPYDDLTPTHMQPFSPFVQADGYNYYGATPFWAAIVNGTSQYSYGTNGFDDYRSWFGVDGYKLNPSVNDLMFNGVSFKYWDGASWTALPTAPTFTFDFAKYISIWHIPTPNIVFLFLGKNDFHIGVENWSTFKETMDSLIASIHSYNSNIIIGVCTPTTADEAENNVDNANSFLGHMNMWNARKLMIENYDELSASGVFIVDTGTTLDPDYGFVMEERLPFAFYEGNEKELFAINGVHPSEAGYKQIGTCIAGFIQAKR